MVCDAQVISCRVDEFIAEEELPANGRLRVKSRFDGVYPRDEDERQAYFEFVSWYMNLDWLPILSIRQKYSEEWYPPKEFDEMGNDVSAFNTADFKRLIGWKPNVEAWLLKMIMDRLYDLAQTYSCISDEVGKANIKARFDEVVYFEFKRKLNLTGQAKYLKRLQEAEKIWKETAFQE